MSHTTSPLTIYATPNLRASVLTTLQSMVECDYMQWPTRQNGEGGWVAVHLADDRMGWLHITPPRVVEVPHIDGDADWEADNYL